MKKKIDARHKVMSVPDLRQVREEFVKSNSVTEEPVEFVPVQNQDLLENDSKKMELLKKLMFHKESYETLEIDGMVFKLKFLSKQDTNDILIEANNQRKSLNEAELYVKLQEFYVSHRIHSVNGYLVTELIDNTENKSPVALNNDFYNSLPNSIARLIEEATKRMDKSKNEVLEAGFKEVAVKDSYSRLMWKVFKANPSIRPKLLTSTYDDEELLWIATNQVAEEEALFTAINNNVDYLTCFINPQLYQKSKETNSNTIRSDNSGFKAALEQVLGRKLTDEEFALHVGKKMTETATILDEAEVKKMLELVKRYYESSLAIGKDKINELQKYMNQGLSNVDFTPIYDSFDYIKTQVKQLSGEFKAWLGSEDMQAIMNVAVKSFKEFSSIFADAGDGSGGFLKNMIEIADLFVANKAMQFFNGVSNALRKLQPLHDRIMKSTLEGMETQSDFIRNIPFDETESTTQIIRYNVSDVVDLYKRQTNDLRGNFLISADAAKTFVSSLSNSELDLRTMEQLSINVKGGTKALYGISAAFALARGSGIDFSNASKLIGSILKETGGTQEEVTEAFGLLKDAQNRTGLSSNTVARSIMDGAENFKYFGNNVKQVTSVYNALIKTLGSGKEGLAADIFRDITSNLANMEDGMKGFLSMSAGYGSSPLAASLKFEEALASGDGLGEILNAMKQEIIRLSGSPLMSRAEAIKGGQEDQYQILRRVVSQVSGVDSRDSGKIDYIIKMLQGGDFEKVTKEDASALYENATVMETASSGAIDKASNAISLFNDTIAQEFIPKINALNNTMASFTQFMAAQNGEMDAPYQVIAEFAAGIPEKLAEKLYNYAKDNPDKLKDLPEKIQKIIEEGVSGLGEKQVKEQLAVLLGQLSSGDVENAKIEKLAQVLGLTLEQSKLGGDRLTAGFGAAAVADKGASVNNAQSMSVSAMFERGITLTPETINALATAVQKNINITINGNKLPVTGNVNN